MSRTSPPPEASQGSRTLRDHHRREGSAASAEFLLTTLVVVATPGTGVLDTRAAAVAATGCTLGIVPHVLAAATAPAALLHTSAVAFQVLKYAGVAYLLCTAVSTLRQTGALAAPEDCAPRSARSVIVSGVLVTSSTRS